MKSWMQTIGLTVVACGLAYFSIRMVPYSVISPAKESAAASGVLQPPSIMRMQGAEAVKLTCSGQIVQSGEEIEAAWSGLNDHAPDDWIGIFTLDEYNNKELATVKTGGGSEGKVKIQIPVTAPSVKFHLRMYSHGMWVLIQTSEPFEIQNLIKLEAASEQVKRGDSVMAAWSGLVLSATNDWIGVFPQSETDNTCLIAMQTGGGSSGNLVLPIPPQTSPGNFELRFYSQGMWMLVTKSKPFQITR